MKWSWLLLACSCASSRPLPDRAALAGVSLAKLDGGSSPIADLRGRVVLLDFWATWCEPCKEALPFYAQLQRELGERGFTVAAVSVDADDAPVRQYFAGSPPPFLVLRDPDGDVAQRMGVSVMPTSFLLDRAGEPKFRNQGFTAADQQAIRARVLSLLDR